MSDIAFYRCEVCGNTVALIRNGGGTLTCCGKTMKRLEANTTDAAKEKHVPVVVKNGSAINVAVGSTLHPMLTEHFIEWIAVVAGSKLEFKFLQPGDEPKAEFAAVQSGTVYAYCNLHGLWKADF